MKATETELFTLAVLLKDQADDKKLWNADLTSINTDIQLHNDKCNQFRRNQKNYAVLKNKFMILNSRSYVSKKITKEGWKVGYMERSEPMDETDSGWALFAGDEGEDYVSDAGNFDVISVGAVCQQLDSDIFKYIDMPAGTRLIRISPDAFEADKLLRKGLGVQEDECLVNAIGIGYTDITYLRSAPRKDLNVTWM